MTWPDGLPDEDAPPWVCLSEPGAPVVLRRYDATSRTCDVISPHGRWLLESCLIPRHPKFPNEIQHGWDLAVGDVQPGWCIVYAGHELWFPQRILRVETIDDDWQRVWTLGDQSTRDVWGSDETYAWDNGLATGWSYDQMSWPHWPEGPWWPLQSVPLSEDVRRFVLNSFRIAVDCPECGKFGQPIVFGLVLSPPPYVAIGGCGITGDDPDYVCDCGARWSVTDQGSAHVPWEFASHRIDPSTTVEADGLNYDIDDVYPYGEDSEHFFQDLQAALVEEAGGAWKRPAGGGEEEFDPDVYIRYWGRDRYEAEVADYVSERFHSFDDLIEWLDSGD